MPGYELGSWSIRMALHSFGPQGLRRAVTVCLLMEWEGLTEMTYDRSVDCAYLALLNIKPWAKKQKKSSLKFFEYIFSEHYYLLRWYLYASFPVYWWSKTEVL